MPTTLLKVRYYAHVGQLTGYGRAATEYAMAMLKHPGFDLDVVPLGEGALDERTKVLMPKIQRGDFTPDVVLVHTLPRDCERVLDAVKIDARATPCAAMTTWEAATFPEQHLSWFTPFRRVLVPSEAAKRAIDSPWLPRHRCAVVPHCYDPTLVEMMRAAMPPAPTDPDRPFVFYYVGAWNRRKNVEGLLRRSATAASTSATPSSAGRCGGAGETRSPQGGERGTPEPAPDPALASTFPSPTRLPSYPPMTGGSRGDSP